MENNPANALSGNIDVKEIFFKYDASISKFIEMKSREEIENQINPLVGNFSTQEAKLQAIQIELLLDIRDEMINERIKKNFHKEIDDATNSLINIAKQK